MERYEPGDIATFYFVIRVEQNEKMVRGWTDNKQLLEFYMDFHKCPKYSIKKITKPIEEIHKITEENYHDEIVIGNIYTKDRDGKDDKKMIAIPVTSTELTFIATETNTSFSGLINYGYLNGVIPYLKGKYREGLSDIFLTSLIRKEVENKKDKYNQVIDFDQLMLLFRSFPDDFGK